MKARKVKRCVKRTYKKHIRGMYRGKYYPIDNKAAGAIFVSPHSSVLQPTKDDCLWLDLDSRCFYFHKGHGHWIDSKHILPMAVSYA